MRDIRTGISIDSIKEILAGAGYQTIESSVHGKNQTRFTHLIVEKDGRRFFCKVNNDSEVYSSQVNQTLSSALHDSPAHITFLAPVDTIENEDHVFHIYPYIDRLPVSSESERFTDFQVPEAEVRDYLSAVLDAIAYVGSQHMVSAYETRHKISAEKTVLMLLEKLPKDTPHAVEFLQYVLQEGRALNEFSLAIDDIQPQNMFWNSADKSLIVFDLENLMPKKKYYDYAKFCAQLWVVYGRSEYAKQFAAMMFERCEPDKKGEAYSYFRYHMTHEALLYYWVFRDENDRKRDVEMMQWIRRDLLALANA